MAWLSPRGEHCCRVFSSKKQLLAFKAGFPTLVTYFFHVPSALTSVMWVSNYDFLPPWLTHNTTAAFFSAHWCPQSPYKAVTGDSVQCGASARRHCNDLRWDALVLFVRSQLFATFLILTKSCDTSTLHIHRRDEGSLVDTPKKDVPLSPEECSQTRLQLVIITHTDVCATFMSSQSGATQWRKTELLKDLKAAASNLHIVSHFGLLWYICDIRLLQVFLAFIIRRCVQIYLN